MKTKIEIIKETKNYYAEDTSRRAVIRRGCEYITRDGRMCAVGRCCNDPEPGIRFRDALKDLKREYEGHKPSFWADLQAFHDTNANWNEDGLTQMGEGSYERLLDYYENEN